MYSKARVYQNRMTYSFTLRKDFLGYEDKPHWTLDNLEDSNVVTSVGVAHDILEHIPDDDFSVAHELLALGASIWGRGYQGHAPPGNLGVDIHSILNWIKRFGSALENIPAPEVPDPYPHLYIEYAIGYSEWRIHKQDKEARERDPNASLLGQLVSKEDYENITHWLLRGWLNAAQRYADIGSKGLAHHYYVLYRDLIPLGQKYQTGNTFKITPEKEGYSVRVYDGENRLGKHLIKVEKKYRRKK